MATATKPVDLPVERMFTLFDAAQLTGAEIVLWEEESPGAEYAARLWASPKAEMHIDVRTHIDLDIHALRVVRHGKTFITVYREVLS